jgi:cyclopropane-fatty-acyl-phospholipid synthase
MEAMKLTGCRVARLTLSIQQKTLAKQRTKEAGISERIEILLCDYRDAPTPEGGYDRVVSVEMIEHVGKEHIDVYFREIEKRLNNENGPLSLTKRYRYCLIVLLPWKVARCIQNENCPCLS